MSKETLEIIAQRRSVLNRLKEKINVPMHISENVSSVYKEQMQTVRAVDKQMRELAHDMAPALKNAKRAFKERRLLDVAHYIGLFNDSLKAISKLMSQLEQLKSDHLDEFYTEMHAPENNPYKNYFGEDVVAEINQMEGLLKQADILNVFKSDRERASRLLEKMYSKQLKKRLADISSLIDRAQSTMENVITTMEGLDKARASGSVNDYIANLNKISGYYRTFEDRFRKVYTEHFMPLITKVKEREQADAFNKSQQEEQVRKERENSREEWQGQKAEQEEIPDLDVSRKISPPEPKPLVKTEPSIEVESPQEVTEPKMDLTLLPGGGESNTPPKNIEIVTKPTIPAQKVSKEQFFNNLIKLASLTDDPYVISTVLSKYSEQLEDDNDIESSIKLLAVAESYFNG